MNCKEAKLLAALEAGGELEYEKHQALREHLEHCPACAEDFALLSGAVNYARSAAETNPVPELEDDFTDTLMRRIENETTAAELVRPRIFHRFATVMKIPAVAAAALICITLLYRIRTDRTEYNLAMIHELLMREAAKPRAELTIENGRIGSISIEGPVRLDDWENRDVAGIFAVLHKPDPETRPDTYIVDYLGEAERLSVRGFTWQRAFINTALTRAGNEDNIYIALYHMPDSSERERKIVTDTLIRKYKPHFNTGA